MFRFLFGDGPMARSFGEFMGIVCFLILLFLANLVMMGRGVEPSYSHMSEIRHTHKISHEIKTTK